MIVRKAGFADAEAVATYLLLAMEEIVYQVIGKRDEQEATAFLLHFAAKEENQYSYQNCWVAEAEARVVAAVNVYDGAHLHALRQPVVDYIRSYYDPGFSPEDETGPGEYYIDTLGVHPGYQGKGVGTGLLQFLIEEYVTKQRQTLGLLVDEENPKAKQLYIKLGFVPVGRKLLLGIPMEHLQIGHL